MGSEKRLKIVYCNPSLHIAGGIERVLSVKANYFAGILGYEIHIILTDGKGKTPFFKLHPSIQIHQLDINYDEWLPFYLRFFAFFRKRSLHQKRLNQYLNRIKPNITILLVRREVSFIHKMTDGSLKIGENHIDKNRYLTSINPLLAKYVPEFLLKRWRKQFIRKLSQLDRFVLLTQEDKLAWRELDNLTVIPNPLTFIPQRISSVNDKKVIAVGRYDRQKGFDLLISAWRKVAVVHPDWGLWIYGDGVLRQELQHQIVLEGVSQTCHLEYPVKNIGDKYAESSLFVLSSRFEGFGLVIVEAMACGLPVVSFACPCGPRDIISDGVDGFLVENEDGDALAQKMMYLIENEEERNRMGQNALRNVQRYQIGHIVMLWENLFKELHLL